jgi:signal transduction histidine kinase
MTRSKTAIKILLGFSLFLSLLSFLSIITGFFAEASDNISLLAEILNSKVFFLLLSLLIGLSVIGLIIFIKPLISSNRITLALSGREDELMREALRGDDALRNPQWELLSKVSGVNIGSQSVPLASSYNKMVEALQKVNEMEKKHSVELADANRKLQREITERERAEKEIRYLSRKLLNGIEEAQKKLARDLHDEFGQTLASLHLNAEAISNAMPAEHQDQKKRIEEVTVLIEQLGDKIRNISSDLRPDLLDDLGLVPTLEWYIKEFHEKRRDIKINFQSVGIKRRLPPEIEIVLYRLFQESLNNVVKHAKANQVDVMLTYNYPKAIFVVRDNGVGFDEQTRHSKGIGLIGMRERVVSLNGTIDIRSVMGKGTTIRAELPVLYEKKESA